MTRKTKASLPEVYAGTNLSIIWAELFLRIVNRGGEPIAPLIVSLEGFNKDGEVYEVHALREKLDQTLKALGAQSVENCAFTIFPQRLWNMASGDREQLYELYKLGLPGYKAMNKQLNRLGLYFERLVDYGPGLEAGNQLEWILTQYHRNRGIRHTMLQACIFDPARDHSSQPYLGFPCLQHVTFVPSKEGLAVNAFYATQQLLERAYGNFLGLTQLGAFMAREMELPLARVNIIVGEEKIAPVAKEDRESVKALKEACETLLRGDANNAGPQPSDEVQQQDTSVEA